MNTTIYPSCKNLFVIFRTGQYCDQCYYRASKAQVTSITAKWNNCSEERIEKKKIKNGEKTNDIFRLLQQA